MFMSWFFKSCRVLSPYLCLYPYQCFLDWKKCCNWHWGSFGSMVLWHGWVYLFVWFPQILSFHFSFCGGILASSCLSLASKSCYGWSASAYLWLVAFRYRITFKLDTFNTNQIFSLCKYHLNVGIDRMQLDLQSEIPITIC